MLLCLCGLRLTWVGVLQFRWLPVGLSLALRVCVLFVLKLGCFERWFGCVSLYVVLPDMDLVCGCVCYIWWLWFVIAFVSLSCAGECCCFCG